MAVHDISFPSTNKIDTIRGWIITPTTEDIKGVVHLIHGYGEHFRRYGSMVNSLLDHGLVVAGDDHVGHGLTAESCDRRGMIGTADPAVFIEDERILRSHIDDYFPEVPVAMIGHSLGSLIARSYMARYGSDIVGAVLIGTLGRVDGMDRALTYSEDTVARDGIDAKCEVLGDIFKKFSEHFGDSTSAMAWNAADPAVVRDYETDPLSLASVIPSAGLSAAVCALWKSVNSPEWFDAVANETPVMLISGKDDPAGGLGAGIEELGRKIFSAGNSNVRVILVPGARHEVFNEGFAKSYVNETISQAVLRWV